MGRRRDFSLSDRLNRYLPQPGPERVVLVGVEWSRPQQRSSDPLQMLPDESLDELTRLSETAGLEVAGRVVQLLRDGIHPATFIGAGKVMEVKEQTVSAAANVVVFD